MISKMVITQPISPIPLFSFIVVFSLVVYGMKYVVFLIILKNNAKVLFFFHIK